MNYAEIQVPGLATPLLQFVRGEAQTLVARAVPGRERSPECGQAAANRSEAAHGIENDIMALRDLVTIDSSLHAPPVVKFV